MPLKPIDYSKTIIYKLQHEDNEELVYVGHTTEFIKRKNLHKSRCNNVKGIHYNYKVYQMIRANGGWNCFKMVMIEQYPCDNKLEACKREDECMKELKATMNSHNAVFNKEKRKDNDRIYREQYYIEHKEEINERGKKWREENKEHTIKMKKNHREQHREELNEKDRQYRQKNKEELNRKARERYALKKADKD